MVLSRRHLLRARNAEPGRSIEILHDDGYATVILLVAMTAGRALSGSAPVDDGTAIQVLQGQVRVRGWGRSATTFPGEMVVGRLAEMDVTALTDSVLLLTCTRPRLPNVLA